MADSTCVLKRCLPVSSIRCDREEQGGQMRALGESISLGRFTTESLSWEKWSSFSRNRYVEEAAQYSQPGSVAQMKAFFEAHYKRIHSANTAPSTEEEIPEFGNQSSPESEVVEENMSEKHTNSEEQPREGANFNGDDWLKKGEEAEASTITEEIEYENIQSEEESNLKSALPEEKGQSDRVTDRNMLEICDMECVECNSQLKGEAAQMDFSENPVIIKSSHHVGETQAECPNEENQNAGICKIEPIFTENTRSKEELNSTISEFVSEKFVTKSALREERGQSDRVPDEKMMELCDIECVECSTELEAEVAQMDFSENSVSIKSSHNDGKTQAERHNEEDQNARTCKIEAILAESCECDIKEDDPMAGGSIIISMDYVKGEALYLNAETNKVEPKQEKSHKIEDLKHKKREAAEKKASSRRILSKSYTNLESYISLEERHHSSRKNLKCNNRSLALAKENQPTVPQRSSIWAGNKSSTTDVSTSGRKTTAAMSSSNSTVNHKNSSFTKTPLKMKSSLMDVWCKKGFATTSVSSTSKRHCKLGPTLKSSDENSSLLAHPHPLPPSPAIVPNILRRLHFSGVLPKDKRVIKNTRDAPSMKPFRFRTEERASIRRTQKVEHRSVENETKVKRQNTRQRCGGDWQNDKFVAISSGCHWFKSWKQLLVNWRTTSYDRPKMDPKTSYTSK